MGVPVPGSPQLDPLLDYSHRICTSHPPDLRAHSSLRQAKKTSIPHPQLERNWENFYLHWKRKKNCYRLPLLHGINTGYGAHTPPSVIPRYEDHTLLPAYVLPIAHPPPYLAPSHPEGLCSGSHPPRTHAPCKRIFFVCT